MTGGESDDHGAIIEIAKELGKCSMKNSCTSATGSKDYLDVRVRTVGLVSRYRELRGASQMFCNVAETPRVESWANASHPQTHSKGRLCCCKRFSDQSSPPFVVRQMIKMMWFVRKTSIDRACRQLTPKKLLKELSAGRLAGQVARRIAEW